jgi:NDP-sugar pyrophosphorylase family protein
MADSLAGVALAAGAGSRLRPLTIDRPKVLCPVANRALLDHALDRLRSVTAALAVNAHATQPQVRDHVDRLSDRIEVSVEEGPRLGTAGALGGLRDWIDGRAAVVVNGDTWCPGGLDALIGGWGGETIRILVGGTEPFGPRARLAGALMPWTDVVTLDAVPSGLWEVSWQTAQAEGRIETVHHDGPFVDCADPADYLEANLRAAGGSVVGADAEVDGIIEDCVIWSGARVRAGERLRRAIRTDTGRTVLVRKVWTPGGSGNV